MICCPAAFHSSFDYLIHLILLCAWQLHSCFPGSACKFAVLVAILAWRVTRNSLKISLTANAKQRSAACPSDSVTVAIILTYCTVQ